MRLAHLVRLLLLTSLGSFTLAQDPLSNSGAGPASSTNPIGEQILNVYRDPNTGREMEVVQVTRAVPDIKYVMKEVKESRVVPEWTQEVKQATQFQHVPVTEMTLQQRWVGRFNPFVQPRLVYDSVPVTRWQANPVVVNVPVNYPKYVVKENIVRVPEPQQTTRLINEIVTRPRGSRGLAGAVTGTNDRANPYQNAAQLAYDQRNINPVGNYPLQSIPNGLPTLNPITVAPVSLANSTTGALPLGAYGRPPLINASGLNPSRWVASQPVSNGPIFSQPLLPSRGQQSFATTSYPGTSIPSQSSQSVLPSSSPFMRPSTLGGSYAPVLPQTAAIPGSGTFRDPTQTGLRPTELR